MAKNYSLPLTTEVDEGSPLNETLFNTRIRGTLLGLGLPNSALESYSFGGNEADGDQTFSGDTSAAAGPGGESQNSNLTIEAGVTLTVTSSVGIFGITGTFTLEGSLVSAYSVSTVPGSGAAGAKKDGTDGISNKRSGMFSATAGSGGGAQSVDTGDGAQGGDGGTALFYPAAECSVGSAPNDGTNGVACASSSSPAWWKDAGVLAYAPTGGGGACYGAGHGDGGDGGYGGPVFYIECGALDFPVGGTINVGGADGEDGGTTDKDGGGGGGGAGGWCIIVTRTVIDDAGTIIVDGGAGGDGHNGGDGGDGGAGAFVIISLEA
jgi:hypothetical protein